MNMRSANNRKVEIELCEGLITQLNPGEYNAMGLHPAHFY